jgi:hypothetical protein
MATLIYPQGKKAFLEGDIDLIANTIKVVLIDTADYTYNAAHDNLDDVAVASRVATSGALAGKTVTVSGSNAVFDANDITLTGVTGDQAEALILFVDTGVEATSKLIAYIDSFASGMPVTPNGGNINIVWDNGASKIFAI